MSQVEKEAMKKMEKGKPRTEDKNQECGHIEFKERNPKRETRTLNLSSCLVRWFRGLNELGEWNCFQSGKML